MMDLFAREIEPAEVVSVPGILGGMPVLKGTRVPAETIRQYLIAGDGPREIFSDYPWIPVGSVEAVRKWCEDNGLACSAS